MREPLHARKEPHALAAELAQVHTHPKLPLLQVRPPHVNFRAHAPLRLVVVNENIRGVGGGSDGRSDGNGSN